METLPTPRIPRISGTLAAPPRETVLRPRKPALHEKRLVLVLALASMLGGCVVVPARPAYYRPAPNYYYYPAYPAALLLSSRLLNRVPRSPRRRS